MTVQLSTNYFLGSLMNKTIGVPAIPLQTMGFHHFTNTPLYFANGCLYHIPESQFEYSLFAIEGTENPEHSARISQIHPKGGHNYYNLRDMERLIREMRWLNTTTAEDIGWEERYLKRLNDSGVGSIGKKWNSCRLIFHLYHIQTFIA